MRARVAAGEGRYATSIRDEFENAASDMRAAGVPDRELRRAIRQAYKYFDALGAFER
jgi:hypothetical protein